ncbi:MULTISPECIES: EF-hand domain-containing protein [unclassified Mesorhizobium]|uniref:EF-hand domain-containing protein n=2 Tax=unclassified Mesorhizobium TaxID=325217 RepID=UPI001FE12427|nr:MULTISPECIES: EF-hand domain-containing protein [unclassified Mesorhizobium]MCT2579356.1 EF-hand domain-containing protein [Mesorhizobium sp. P13.3]MDF3168469.1 EF-hand domain-containing protein [Mesorhizobium sp. P16.1]MDF3185383.1 EF-hand domain-containing protein [Mesorhizobium sp. ICCV3110.1]
MHLSLRDSHSSRENPMKLPYRTTAAAAALLFMSFPVLAQTSAAPEPTPIPQKPGPTATPEANAQPAGPTREVIRQMIDDALQEKLQEDRSAEQGPRHGGRWHREDRQARRDGDRMAGRPDRMGPRMMHRARMQVMFAIVDADGDGALSQGEVQDIVGRIFNAADEDGDGSLDLDELQSFMHGSGGGRMR